MRYRLRTLFPFQISLLSLFAFTTLAAIASAVIALPSNAAEKISALTALALLLQVWYFRNYLHPLQATIPYGVRCRIAMLDFFSTTMIWPPLFIWLYFWMGHRDNHAIWLTDVVFCGSLFCLWGLAIWKLVRAFLPGSQWINTIEA